MKTKLLVLVLGTTLWPLSLLSANSPTDFFKYAAPAILLLTSFLLWTKYPKFYFLPILIIPLVETKLSLFPVIFFILKLILEKRKSDFLLLGISLLTLAFSWKSFYGQTIFVPDYEARQEVIRKTQLYDSVFLARLFHNKARLVLDKFTVNFFALTDPNNYFFGFHPRQIVENQNITKFPFIGLVFVFYGLYHFSKFKEKRFLFYSLTASLLALSQLTLFDRNDFLLWTPLTLIFIHGVYQLEKRPKYFFFFSALFIVFAIPEFIRLLVTF